jgi:ubiquinone/menaquinone biosynthesis C-methylase UbiE
MAKSHLDFYNQHGISPVHYRAASVQEHFERRASLYRSLGLTPLTFRDAHVLEVAVGSGQNSLYVASLMPASLTLVEPNPTGIREIRSLYAQAETPHVTPTLVEATLQNYVPEHRFDIVICENWLGRARAERLLLRKLAGFVAPQGILVVTTFTPTGFLPNLIRRALAVKYCDPGLPFAVRTERLVAMFAPHLASMRAMTRSATDWVQDNMLNPAYFDLCLTIPDVLQELDGVVTALDVNPAFALDWRWFKALHGEARDFNRHMVSEYEASLHNFFDYQLVFEQPDRQLNREIESGCFEFLEAVRAYEYAALTRSQQAEKRLEMTAVLQRLIALMSSFPDAVKQGFQAGLQLLEAEHDDYRRVAEESPFSRLFGRETVYLSLLNDQTV